MTPAATLGLRSAWVAVIVVLSGIVTGIHDCYDSQRREYVGNSTELATCTDCECLPWPPEYGFPENYCRFVEGSDIPRLDIPRCLVDNYLGVHLEDCNVPSCDVHTTCYRDDGSDYRDGGEFTESGYQCLQWDNVQDRGVNSTMFPLADLTENYCRNPDGESRPWCYFLANGTIQKGYCAIAHCTSGSALLFDQLQLHTLVWDTSSVVETVSFKPAQFTVETCLQTCADNEDFKCRSVIVDTLRRSCLLNDVNQFFVNLLETERFDFYLRKDTVCDVFEITDFGQTECLLPIGVEVGLIQDAQLSASSYASDDHAPWAGRLNGPSSWMPDPEEFNSSAMAEARPYLQIDFLEIMKVTGLMVQGGGGNGSYYGNWVEEFTVLVTHDPVGGVWDKVGVYTDTVTEFGPVAPKIFPANREANCIQTILFDEAVFTRYLRINPTKWHGQVALRVEVIGCRDNGCDNSLGMINGQIADSQLGVSTYFNPNCAEGAARLDPFYFEQSCGWKARPLGYVDSTMTIRLGRPHVVTSIVTQGCEDGRVTSFRVSHVNKNLNRVAVPEDISVTEVIGGNSQASHLYRHTLSSPVECTAIYITILEWVGMACLKVELVGCLSLSGCRQRLGMESGRIADHQISTESVNRTGSSLTVSATPRLHQWLGLSSGWNLEYSTGAEWLQIDLLTLHTVTGFIVQAGREHQYSLWVDTYLLLYAADRAGADGLTTETWRPYVDKEGVTMTFRGSHSPYTISHHTLYRSFIARKIRIKPVSWSSLYPGLRAEVIGCELADHGDFCSENTTRYKGFCLGVANRDEAWTCDAVFAHHATQVVIHSAPMQQAVVNVLQNSELQTYLIGLRIVASSDEPSYTWLDGSVITYNNFDPSIQIPYTSNSSEVSCVKVNTAHDFHWEVTTCDALFFNSRGTVCQYDLDECAGNHGCSHECLNYPGGYQCQCPTGYILDSETRKDCIPVCSNYTDSASTWNQRGKWCYTEGAENATWHDANSACLSLGAGIRLPTMDDAFWADFDGAWNLTWVSMGNAFPLSETNPSFRQDSPQMYQNSSFETNCTAIDLSVRPFEVQEWVGSCNLSLSYVCIMEFASLEDLDDGSSFITAETPLGYFRSWHYPPHLESDHIRTELRFSLPENYTVRFDISYLAIPQSEEFEENSFAIFEILPDSNVSVRRAFFRGAQKRGVSVIGSGSEVQAVFNVSSFHPWHGDPSVVGIETLFTVVECASNCRSYCGSSPSILTNATGSFGILNTLLDMYARCRWLISLEKGKFVRLRLREYDLSNNSRLSVIYGNVPEGDYRAYDVDMRGGTRPFFIADTNEVTVFLITTGVQEDSGFWMDYDSVDSPGCNVGHTAFLCSDFARPCDTDISCNYQSAYIATKAYPGSLSASTTATWQIQTPPGTFVEIVFEHINIPSVQQSTCTNGYITLLEVIDELDPDTIVEGLCNVNLPTGALRSKQNRVRLELRTAYDTSDNIFLAKYEGLHFQSRREVVVTSDHCETGWFYFNQHCYRLSDSETLIRWDDANTRCGREDATLVSMRDRDEAEYVHYMLTTEWFTTRTNTYIGLTNRNLQGVFTWSDKSPMSYTDWALTFTEEEEEEEEIERFEYNSPNGGSLESCTMIKLEDFSTSANWVDVACAAREAYQYLCKKEAEDFTQPASIGDFVGQDDPRQCPQHLFQCSTGECIQRIFLCDSAVDCSDGSDEGAVCSTGLDYARFKFQCEPREVSASLVCDFIQDCDQGADERNCLRAECDTTQFQCQNGQCIDLSKRCDLINPCSEDTSIEGNGCELITGGFQCYSSRWIPVEYQCDSFPDCGGLHYEDEIPCQDKYVASCESDNVIPCRSGICVDQNHTCIHDFDRHGYIQGCRDVTHLRDCESFQCPEMMFKCPDSYCIPIRLRCDNVFDCPNKEDEKQCDEYICPGAYRCRNHEQCVSLDQLCDGKPDCPGHENDRGGDDELFCNVSCPSSCECVGLSYVCESTEWGPGAASMISTKVRQLFLNSVASIGAASNLDNGSTRRKRDQIPASDTVMDKLFLNFSHYPLLVDLELKDNGITELSPGLFNNSHSIRTLDLSLNNIDVLRSGTFQGLSSLENLSLSGNSLSNIEVGAFAGLFNLKVLEIRDTSPIKSSDGFEDLESLETIIASKYLYCCVKESVECIAPTDQFSDCHDLISNSALRFFMWLLGLSALAGNALVFGMRMVNRCRVGGARRDATPVQTFLITNLAASDFLMGVYMIIIAGADLHFRNNYAFHAEGWRAGLACKIAGVLSILSSEVSVFVIMLLSLDRFFKIVFPFRFGLHLTSRRAQWLVLASWVVGLLMCLLPALVTVYFTHSYYGSSSVCLALPLVPDLPRGWEYMFFLLVVNLICFSIMLICYAAIFVAVKRSSQQSRGSSAQSSAEVRVAAKMALIVGTDFICWMPIIILAILASFGQVAIPQAVYAWIAIFILPLNSSINPYLYTLSNYWGQRKKKKSRAKNSLMLNQGYSPSPMNRTRSSALGIDGFNDSQSADFELQPMLKIVLSQLEQHRILPVVRKEPSHLCSPPGGSPNGNICASNQDAGSRNWSLTEHDLTCVVDDVTAALSWLHDNGISGIHLNEDSILLDKDSNGQQRAYLQLPQSILGVDAPTSKLRESSADIGVELDNKALENLIGRLRNNASLAPDEQKTQIDSGQLMTISHL